MGIKTLAELNAAAVEARTCHIDAAMSIAAIRRAAREGRASAEDVAAASAILAAARIQAAATDAAAIEAEAGREPRRQTDAPRQPEPCPVCGAHFSPEEVGHNMCRKCAEKDMARRLGAGMLWLPADWYAEPKGGK